MKEVTEQMIQYRFPRWEELPQLELYIDQVVLYLQELLSPFDKEGSVTPTMINNYVKQKIVSPPAKKKYSREHMACFFMIFTMKRLMNISALGAFITRMRNAYQMEHAYNLFCEEMEYALKSTFEPKKFPPRTYEKEEQTELSLLRSMTVTFAQMVLTDKLITFNQENEEGM